MSRTLEFLIHFYAPEDVAPLVSLERVTEGYVEIVGKTFGDSVSLFVTSITHKRFRRGDLLTCSGVD